MKDLLSIVYLNKIVLTKTTDSKKNFKKLSRTKFYQLKQRIFIIVNERKLEL
jgi:hypothetical protein